MPWPVHPNGLLGAQGDNDSYQISRSLRFNDVDSAYLNKTFTTPTNNKIFTYSCWVKSNGSTARQPIFVATNAVASLLFAIEFAATTQTLQLWDGNYSAAGPALVTSQVFRDTSAWYHIVLSVDTTQATASNRIRLYVNGSQITAFSSANYAAQNSSPYMNSAVSHNIGSWTPAVASYANLYMTELNFIDGQSLTPSSFGETDAITGRWKAKAYSGTYGTNGFYLKFADNSGVTAATIGKDSSGNSNNWTPNNFSVTAGVGNDSLVDSPTNYGSDAGVGGEVRGNYATLNTIDKGGSINTPTNGNLDITSNATGFGGIRGTVGVSSGKWYWEFESTSSFNELGICSSQTDLSTYVAASSSGYVYVSSSGNKANNGTFSSYGSTFISSDTIGIAFNADSGSIEFYKNNVSQGVAFSSIPSGTYFPAHSDDWGSSSVSGSYNFGQRPFKYTAPTGFKALCTTNLTTPTIKKPSSYFDVLAYTGTGASNSISSLGFSPDLVWIKNRGAATSHAIYDTTRGVQAQLSSDLTSAEVTSSTGLTSFGSSGFTIGTSTLVNTAGTQYVAWGWDESPIAGFDVVNYLGDGSAGKNISHNLGVAPKFMIVKNRVTAGFDFFVYHASMNATPQGGYMALNGTLGYTANTTIWNNTAPTSSVFTVGTNTAVNKTGENHIAYLWAEVDGFSKIGSYVGNSSADGVFVWCGFRPRYILFKNPGAAAYWQIYDAARNTYNVVNSDLYAGNGASEQSDASLDMLSNGFKARSITYINDATINFVAFAESPFKYARAR